jgi:tetratricopeptide (TPR) repeat protein
MSAPMERPISSIVRYMSRSATLGEAEAMFLRGDVNQCLSATEDDPSVEATILRARVFLRLRNFKAATLEIGKRFPSPDNYALSSEHFCIRAASLAQDDLAATLELLDQADMFARLADDAERLAESNYYRAASYFVAGRMTDSFEIASKALADTTDSCRPRLLEIQGLIYGIWGEVSRKIAALDAAIDCYRSLEKHDLFLQSNCVSNLLITVAETHNLAIANKLATFLETFPWTADLARKQFWCHYNLGVVDALAGNYLSAFGRFRSAVEAAPTLPLRVFALTARASVSLEIGEAFTSQEFIAEAYSTAMGINWEEALEDERCILLDLGLLCVNTSDPMRARALVDRHQSLVAAPDPLCVSTHGDVLSVAKDLHALGRIGLLDDPEAVAKLYLSHDAFVSVNSMWRAAHVAFDIYEANGDERMLAFVQQEVEHIPHSSLARRLKSRLSERFSA